MNNVYYYIDCSALTVEEYQRVEDSLRKLCVFCDADLRHPRCLVVLWQEDLPPTELLKLPKVCLVRQIQYKM